MCDMFGGSSAAENAGLAQEQGLASTFSADMAQQYQQQQATNTQLQSEIGRLQTGTTGPGFGGAENEAYISGIQNKPQPHLATRPRPRVRWVRDRRTPRRAA